jgi:hypothetical protein
VPEISPLADIPAEGAAKSEMTQLLGSSIQPSEDMTAALAENAAANAAAAQDLLSRLADNPDFQALMDAKAHGDPQAYTEMILHSWSTGFNNPMYQAIQMAVSDEFGLDVELRGSENALYFAREELYKPYEAGFRALVRANYDATQAWFKDQGITEVDLYRGLRVPMNKTDEWISKVDWGAPGTVDKAPIPGTGTIERPLLSPASAFSVNPDEARYFAELFGNADQRAMVLGAKVPVERVLSTSATGLGSKAEAEVIVLGSKTGNTFVYEARAMEATLENTGGTAVAEAAELGGVGTPIGLTYVLPEIDQQAEAAIIQQAQDALAAGGVVSHEDIVALGAPIRDYLNERIGPLADWAKDANRIYNKDPDLSGELMAWIAGDTSQHGGLTIEESLQQYQAAMRQETIRLVDQVRGVGDTELAIADGAPAVLEDVLRQVEGAFPTDWLDASNADGKVTLLQEANRRGYYRTDPQGGNGTIGLRYNDQTTSDQLITAMLHEWGHRMEDSVDGIWQAERDLYDARTADDVWKKLPDDLKVLGRAKFDKFASPYLGKDPIQVVRGGGLPDIYHYELLSSGLEWVLGTDYRGAWLLSKDEEFHQWVLGLLFGAQGKVVVTP